MRRLLAKISGLGVLLALIPILTPSVPSAQLPSSRLPDMVVSDVKIERIQEKSIHVQVYIRNLGDASAVCPIEVAVRPNWLPEGDFSSVMRIDSFDTFSTSLLYGSFMDLPKADYWVFTVDPTDDIKEKDESNNTLVIGSDGTSMSLPTEQEAISKEPSP